MELHKAIRNIVETEGKEIVKDARLVNILSDFRAFDAIPASKYILRAVIADGYAQKLLSIGAWNDKSDNLCTQFAALTGFQYDLAYEIFHCLAYGLGYVSSKQNNHTNNSSKLDNPNVISLSELSDSLCLLDKNIKKLGKQARINYRFSAEEYLNRIIEIKGDWEKDLGIKIRVFSMFKFPYEQLVHFYIEVNGKVHPFPGWPSVQVYFIIYSKLGEILSKIDAYIGRNKTGYDVVESSYLNVHDYKYIGNIGKIVVYY